MSIETPPPLSPPPPQEPVEPKSAEPKSTDKRKADFTNFRTIRPTGKKETKLDDLLAFVKENTRDTVAYVAMVMGIILMFFDTTSVYGSLLVGSIFSLYFIKELSFFVLHASEISAEQGIVKSLIFLGAVLALFLRAPFVFIGMGLILVVKLLVAPQNEDKS